MIIDKEIRTLDNPVRTSATKEGNPAETYRSYGGNFNYVEDYELLGCYVILLTYLLYEAESFLIS